MAPAALDSPLTESVAKINKELAVGEDLGFQRRWWRFERVVWAIFIAVIALDLMGAFGRGPLANAAANSADGSIETTYERIERAGTPSMMTVKLNVQPNGQGRDELFISDSAVSGLGLQRVIPAPETTRVGGGGLTYQFPSGAPPAIVRFEFRPVSAGLYHLIVGAPRHAAIDATVAVVP